MKMEIILGILIGWLLYRWSTGQALLPSFKDEAETDAMQFEAN